MFRPFRAGLVWGRCSQGVALGYRVTPRWGGGAIGAPISSCRIRAHATTPGAHNNRRITLAPTGRPVIARGNAPGKSPATSPSPERARFQDAVPCLNPRAPGFQRGIMRTSGQRPNNRGRPPPPPQRGVMCGIGSCFALSGLDWLGGAVPRALPRLSHDAPLGRGGPLPYPFRLASLRPNRAIGAPISSCRIRVWGAMLEAA
jgi:hypothetical protein